MLVTGDLVAAPLSYMAAFAVRVLIPFPFTSGYLPGVRFDEVTHHWPEMLAAQLVALYLLGLYDTRALTNPRDHVTPIFAAGILETLLLVAVYFFRQDLAFPRSIFLVHAVLNGLALALWRRTCRALMGAIRAGASSSSGRARRRGSSRRSARTALARMDIVGAVAMNAARPSLAARRPCPSSRRDEIPRHERTARTSGSSSQGMAGPRADALSPASVRRSTSMPSPYDLIGRRATSACTTFR
jgi:hypothetical protein